SGIPVIISRQSGVAEVLDNAIKVDYWDDDAMANAIYSLIKYPTLAKHLSRSGREEIKKIKWDFTATDIRNIYEELIDMRNASDNGSIGENFDNTNILIKKQGK
ncbi:MAG: glycosyltransferase, partial [Bacteroidales bacterium]|nr:glycosyltransferase [Bacteroidales bacterium]